MRLLCGAQLSADDVEAIKSGTLQIEGAVSTRMEAALQIPDDELLRGRLEALSWMVAHGTLEIMAVLPRGRDGHPLSDNESRDYFHPKEGCFHDAEGNSVGFTGSCNESANGWEHNYEVFAVYTSWPRTIDGEAMSSGRPFIKGITQRFEELWQGRDPDWIALRIPEAVRLKLLSICPESAPEVDPLERRPIAAAVPSPAQLQRDRILFRFMKEAPRLASASSMGAETSAIHPWPHQQVTSGELIDRYPRSYLICDEVGLGKTIEAGLALRQLIISGRVKRALLLVPFSVVRQWQEELYEKFAMNIPRYEGGVVLDVQSKPLEYAEPAGPWNSFPFLIASSHLARRKSRQEELLSANPWDLLIVDEAHHARRKDFLDNQYRPNRLLELLLGSGGRPGLRSHARCIYLLTATPMQVDPREVWDLLKVIGLGGKWGASDEGFVRFFEQLRLPLDQCNWDFVLDMVRDYMLTGGGIDENFARVAKARLDPVDWKRIVALPDSYSRQSTIAQLDSTARACLHEFAAIHTPVRAYVKRCTRNLLRKYREKGILKENIPLRKPTQVWIALSDGPGSERELYDRIEEYIADFYRKYEQKRTGKGFIMTVYRRRLTSSFHALKLSLERRLEYLRGQVGAGQLFTDEDNPEQDDLLVDFLEQDDRDTELAREELEYVEDFIRGLEDLGTDTKLERLFVELGDLLSTRDKVILFTQYTDTMDYLRDRLRQVYGSQVACYSGRGGEVWNGFSWQYMNKEEIKKEFKAGDHLKILLCTESASEGLNLQTCGVLVNYDMPWNPMRVEQRIGRIDRIGQLYPDVWIRNFFIEETVEAVVYQRLSERITWFVDVVGALQPILQRVARTIEKAAMTPREERQSLLDREIASIREQLETQTADAFDLDKWVDESVKAVRPASGPLGLADLERHLTTSPLTAARFRKHEVIQGAYHFTSGSNTHVVTFSPAVFDEHPYSVRFMTWGEPLLEDLLTEIAEKGTSSPPEGLALLESEATGLRAFYGSGDTEPMEIVTLEAMEKEAGNAPTAWPQEKQELIRDSFGRQVEELLKKETAIEESARKGLELSLKEGVATLLRRAAAVKYADLDLLDGRDATPTPAQALDSLLKLGYPWRGLLSFLGHEGFQNVLSDGLPDEYSALSIAKRKRQLEELTESAKDLLGRIAKGYEKRSLPEKDEATEVRVTWLPGQARPGESAGAEEVSR
ncbi:DEAD/DEAH box helicase family protein [Candidatus Fermentibacteria bacterium]|nr:DEAD/DEAH box helicase family protein [Candidatus Fermentibacteria bacterium]